MPRNQNKERPALACKCGNKTFMHIQPAYAWTCTRLEGTRLVIAEAQGSWCYSSDEPYLECRKCKRRFDLPTGFTLEWDHTYAA